MDRTHSDETGEAMDAGPFSTHSSHVSVLEYAADVLGAVVEHRVVELSASSSL